MSEKIYAFLLRLYPAAFREAYSYDALQLIRDRAHYERGFMAKLRLWLDLLTDVANSIHRGFDAPQVELAGDIPSFHLLDTGSPRRGAVLLGTLLSVATLSVIPLSVGPSSTRHFSRAAFQIAGQPDMSPRNPQVAPAASDTHGGAVDRTERQRVVHTAAEYLRRYYIDPAVSQKVADALFAHQKRGDYESVKDGAAFADLLTKHIREASGDPHLDLVYSQRPLPSGPPPRSITNSAAYTKAMQQENCTFETVSTLRHNIGYLKLNAFADVSACQSTATAAMATLNNADALVIDLRDNRGGFGSMVSFLASYLFDHPEYLFSPRENPTRESWTRSPVPGSKFPGKPVYVLTSGKTASAAEAFTYNLKMLKRATLVGETTRGAAHAAIFHPIDEHFGMGILETKAVNPYADKDWEGTGIEPDIKVPVSDALETAVKHAEARLGKK